MSDPIETLMRAICVAYAEHQEWSSDDICITVALERGEGCVVWLGTIDGESHVPTGSQPEITAPTLEGALLLLAARVEAGAAERAKAVTDAVDALRAAAGAVPRG